MQYHDNVENISDNDNWSLQNSDVVIDDVQSLKHLRFWSAIAWYK